MTSKRIEESQRLAVLKLIQSKKDILFAQSASAGKSNAHQTKEEIWDDIAASARAIGVSARSGSFLRGVTWQNWRKRVLGKCDITSKTRKRRAKKKDLCESDYIILDIMGKDPGALGGLSKVEMSDVTSNALALCVLSEEGSTANLNNNDENSDRSTGIPSYENQAGEGDFSEIGSEPNAAFQSPKIRLAQKKQGRKREVEFEEIKYEHKVLKKQLLELEVYKKKLEVFEIERRVGVRHSCETECFLSITV